MRIVLLAASCFALVAGNAGARTIPDPSANSSPPPSNDDCSTPATLVGTGAFPFDTTSATTGAQGQSEPLCQIGFFTGITNDVWYSWTAPSTGYVTIDTCAPGGTAVGTKMAFYEGTGCPAGAPIACESGACSGQSSFSLFVAAGQAYTIHLGNSPVFGTVPGTGTLTIGAIAPPPANDDCSTPTTVVGIGSFPFDTLGATAGVEGQSETLCDSPTGVGFAFDVWFHWNAPASGTVIVGLCIAGGTAYDTKLAVYGGTGCPTGAAIACNDDYCQDRARVVFEVVAGQDYTFQVGHSPYPGGSTPGTGTLRINPIVGPPANDACSASTTLSGPGPFVFDSAGATTGSEGQAEPRCNLGGYVGIEKDVWYTWTATASGLLTADLCGPGGTSTDTKMAVYDGAGCPSSAAISCDDDACGNGDARVSFTAVIGQAYTFQIGNSPRPGTGTPGTGTITITQLPIRPDCELDDGTTEAAASSNAYLVGLLWMNRFGSPGESAVVRSISVAYGNPHSPGESVLDGSPVRAGIWSDPDGGDPSNAVLLATAFSNVHHNDSDILNTITFSPPVVVDGVYLVGVGLFVYDDLGPAPASMDTSIPSAGRSWYVIHHGAYGEQPNFADLSANTVPPTDADTLFPQGVWRLRADCTTVGTIETFCPGDGTEAACPCANAGGSGRGCANSDPGSVGARLSASGNPALSADTLVFSDTGHHGSSLAVLWQGKNTIAPVGYGDGLRCINGGLKRMFTFAPAHADPLVAPSASSIPPFPMTVSGQSAARGDPLSVGSVRGYLLVYRDPNPAFCPPPSGNVFNASNGVRVAWAP